MKVPLFWLKNYTNLPKDTKDLAHKLTMVGHMLDGVTENKNGKIIDLELRGNRADCYSILGIAREVSAIYGTKIKNPTFFSALKKSQKIKEVELKIQSPFVKRVMMSVVRNVKIVKSPSWLSDKLKSYGVESINNIVDLTNFVAIEMGEPMHAFDLDKIGSKLTIRQAKQNQKMLTFLGKTLTLTTDDMIWANNKDVLSVAGAIGEKNNSISDTTKNILIEAASYDRANIRRSVHRHNLFTEAGIRHEKDLDPNLVEPAINRFLYLIDKYKWGRVTKIVSDYYPQVIAPWKIRISLNNFEVLSGIKISKKEAIDILERLGFVIENAKNEFLEVLVPTIRTDVREEADVIEEILRMVGYDKIPTNVISLGMSEDVTPNYLKQEEKIRASMVALGFNEAITSSFVREDYSKSNMSENMDDKLAALENPPSPDFRDMRLTLFPNLLEVTQKGINERTEGVRLFEVGKVYSVKKGKYIESRKLGIIYYNGKPHKHAYKIRGFISALFEKISSQEIRFDLADKIVNLTEPFGILVKNKTVGFGGWFVGSIYYAEVDLDSILDLSKREFVKTWPKYPPQIEDITIQLPEKTKVGEVINAVSSIKLVGHVELKDTYKDSHTFRVWYQDPNKTLDDKEVKKIREKILDVIEKKFGGVLKA